MKQLSFVVLMLCVVLCGCGGSANLVNQPVPVSPASLSYNDLFSNATPPVPADDGAFALPANATAPTESFEGRLELGNTSSNGSTVVLRDDYGAFYGSDSPWEHLAAFSFEFVQDGRYLIPVQQGLVYTGNAAWNYIVGPERSPSGRSAGTGLNPCRRGRQGGDADPLVASPPGMIRRRIRPIPLSRFLPDGGAGRRSAGRHCRSGYFFMSDPLAAILHFQAAVFPFADHRFGLRRPTVMLLRFQLQKTSGVAHHPVVADMAVCFQTEDLPQLGSPWRPPVIIFR